MTAQQIGDVLRRITYKPGWSLRVVMDTLHATDSIGRAATKLRPVLQVAYDGKGDYGTAPWTGRKWQLSEHMTESEIVYTAFKAILAAEEHETREFFKYEGVEVCGPHFSVRAIVELVQAQRLPPDVRENAMQGAT